MLPLVADHYGPRRPLPKNHLAFSNGRAAMAWLIEQKQPRSALVCAYTCPHVPPFLRRKGITVEFFDVTDKVLPKADLTIIPSMFGAKPIQDCSQPGLLIDAAQTVFGHEDYLPPPGGATFSCPHKSVWVADGSIMALGQGLEGSIDHLPARSSEEGWPAVPRRMSDEAKARFEHLDPEWHRVRRQHNYAILEEYLKSQYPIWPIDGVPFCLPIFVENPAEVFMAMKSRYLFTIMMWPRSEHNPNKHPVAAYMTKHLLGLPVDQRCQEEDMHKLAKAILELAKPPKIVLEQVLSLETNSVGTFST